MFIRRKTMPAGRIKVQIVESMRTRDRVQQKVLRHVGTATSEAQFEALERLAHVILEEMR